MYESFEAIPLTQVYSDLRNITRATLATLGKVYLTPTALSLLKGAGLSPVALAVVHAHGLWYGVDAYEVSLNDQAMDSGGSIRSAFAIDGKADVWLVTQPIDATGKRPSSLFMTAWEFVRGLEADGKD